MNSFSDWINSHSLVDLRLGGAFFTWSNHQSPPSISRLDIFLVLPKWLGLYSEVCELALPKPALDHCPILLDSKPDRWGAAPFHFELYWFENKVFVTLIKDWRKEIRVDGWAGFRLGLKLKMLKGKIR